VGAIFAQSAPAQFVSDALEQGFQTPPDSAKPRTGMHWTDGNVTEEGITKDLEWMKRVGIAGFKISDVAARSGQVVDKKSTLARQSGTTRCVMRPTRQSG
jgi:hypothetical protein